MRDCKRSVAVGSGTKVEPRQFRDAISHGSPTDLDASVSAPIPLVRRREIGIDLEKICPLSEARKA
jgi:hypothetical protein